MSVDELQPDEVLPNTWTLLFELQALPPMPDVNQSAVALNVHPNTIRRRIRDGTIRAYKVGPRLIRVDRESLIEFAQSQVIGA